MSRLDNLWKRRIAQDEVYLPTRVDEAVRSISQSDSVKYLVGATQPIDRAYTRNTIAEAERVQNQLAKRLGIDVEFRLQGSVLCDIHIESKSDIDLLVILKEFEWIEPPNRPDIPFTGNEYASMWQLRHRSEETLSDAFPTATVSKSGAKAIRLSGGSLRREVDVVPASWNNTVDYYRTGDPDYRGVKIFDKNVPKFIANLPFLHRRRIDERDRQTKGGLRKAIRLLKSLAYDSEGRVTMSKFNIAAIGYNIELSDLYFGSANGQELRLLEACCQYCNRLIHDSYERQLIRVPDGHRPVFGDGDGASLDSLHQLYQELASFRSQLYTENRSELQLLMEGRAYQLPSVV